MGILKKVSEVSENIGAGTADFLDNVSEATRGFTCDFWQSFPNYVVNGKNPVSSLTRGFMNNLCADLGNPPAPTPAFSGGQCTGVQYGIRYQTAIISGGTLAGWSSTFQNSTGNLIGAIASIQLFAQNVPCPLEHWSFNGQGIAPTFNNANRQYRLDVVDSTGTTKQIVLSGGASGVRFISFYRIDGQPDNCGNPPANYPENEPNPGDFSSTITINNNDGLDLTVPITIIEGDQHFPFNIDVGGINLQLHMGGFYFNYNPLGGDGTPVPLPDGQDDPLPTPDDLNGKKTVEYQPSPDTDEDIIVVDKAPEDPKEEDIGTKLKYVVVNVISAPQNVKGQWGGENAPDVRYCGWFEWKFDAYYGVRQPIHWYSAIFVAPPGATGYAYTLYNGIVGFASIYTLKTNEVA